jgi:16S rRNA (cytidine1402-2'-O)-methyltransferase
MLAAAGVRMVNSSDNHSACGRLYVVATPIGNVEDITVRAIRTLREVDLIACEDTRRLTRLRDAHAIRTPAISYFEHNELHRIPELLERLRGGESIALVTDAGTPAISDPGFRLVRAAIEAGIPVASIPGPSAVIAALSVAGLPTDRFIFEGFLPAKAGERRRALERLSAESRTMVFYESARRLTELLIAMIEVFGPDRPCVVMREMTKTYEESLRGTLSEVAEHCHGHPPLGEVTLVIAGVVARDPSPQSIQFDQDGALKLLRGTGLSLKDAAAILAKLTGLPRRDIYQRALMRSGGSDG